MKTNQRDIKSMNLKELTDFVTEMGEKPFRAKQLYQWMHQKLSPSFEEMRNLPNAFIETLKQNCLYTSLHIKDVQVSKKDGTRKYLFLLEDQNPIESVFMRYRFGNSVCISSQAGCRMGCKFCASTLGGLVRNLTPSEMLEQIYRIERDVGERISHVVVMGMGEPLDNYDSLLAFLRLLTDENGLRISQRNITVSTCGIAPNIRRLGEEKLAITLAVSLHAPSQEKREKMMPISKRYQLKDVMEACQFYFEQTGRRITFEYALAEGVNDGKEDAMELAKLLSPMNCHVNLIPMNPVRERRFFGSKQSAALAFQRYLEQRKINVTIRREMGRDIDAACGQLRNRQM